jgi:GNAT superfamily N-acetyltransferase
LLETPDNSYAETISIRIRTGDTAMTLDMNVPDLKIRLATQNDTALILQFIKELAEYEHMLNEVVATEDILNEFLFEQKKAEVIIGEYKQQPVCFALFFHNFSTFLGRPGIYLEDLYVKPEMRGKGFGRMVLSYLARLAKERKCGRLEWSCLDWNEPSISFYKKMGARPMEEWTVYRVQDETLDKLADL